MTLADKRNLLSLEHFSVDGTLVQVAQACGVHRKGMERSFIDDRSWLLDCINDRLQFVQSALLSAVQRFGGQLGGAAKSI